MPSFDKDKNLFKPYIALHERRLVENLSQTFIVKSEGDDVQQKPPSLPQQSKPLMKRLFFWE